MIIGEKVGERWKAETDKEIADERDLDATITSFYSDKSNTMDNIKRLAQFTADDFYDWFKTTDNPRLFSIIRALSRIEHRLPLVITETEKVEADVMTALRRISGENKISHIRQRPLIPQHTSISHLL